MMEKSKRCVFTARFVQSLKPTAVQTDYWDEGFAIKGFNLGLRVSSTGHKLYFLRYRKDRKQRRYSLGDAKLISLSTAHQMAREVAGRITDELDPAIERSDYKNAETCDALFDLYLLRHASKKKDGGKEDRRIIARDLRAVWGHRKACDITRRDVVDLLHRITTERDAPVMSNRTRALVSKIFNFAVELEIIQQTPCAALPRKSRETSKNRALSKEELKAVWRALDSQAEPLATVFRLILLTGQRPGEVAAAKWSEFGQKEWTIPGARTKNGREHVVPLSGLAWRLIEGQRFRAKGSEYLFPTDRRPYPSDRGLQHLAERLIEALSIARFTPHDLRRTAATQMRRLGVSRDVVGTILNHRPRDVTDIYDRYDQKKEMRSALERMAKSLEPVGTGKLVRFSA